MGALPLQNTLPIAGRSSELGRSEALAQLRNDLVRRFPGAVAAVQTTTPRLQGLQGPRSPLLDAPFVWVEASVGQGGVAWLAAWTLLRLADDPLGRPALWVDTHRTLTPGDLLDLEGRLVVVRPDDPHEAHVAADIALRSGSFSLVALEMFRALHPTPLARLSRLAASRKGEAHTPIVVWGEPPSFVAPPSGIPRTSFHDALAALVTDPRCTFAHPCPERPGNGADPHEHFTPHSTDRLRPLDRAADRRPPPPPPRDPRRAMDGNVDAQRAPLGLAGSGPRPR